MIRELVSGFIRGYRRALVTPIDGGGFDCGQCGGQCDRCAVVERNFRRIIGCVESRCFTPGACGKRGFCVVGGAPVYRPSFATVVAGLALWGVIGFALWFVYNL